MPFTMSPNRISAKDKKARSQRLAVLDRRNLVWAYYCQHFTVRQIAEKVNVKLKTVEQDLKAIQKGTSGIDSVVSAGKKQRELDELDEMERDAITKLEERLTYIAETIEDKEGLKEMGKLAPKILSTVFNDAGRWYDRRLAVKQMRAKWLGFEQKEQPLLEVNQDNRSISITIQDPNSGNQVSFKDWAEGTFKELPAADASS